VCAECTPLPPLGHSVHSVHSVRPSPQKSAHLHAVHSCALLSHLRPGDSPPGHASQLSPRVARSGTPGRTSARPLVDQSAAVEHEDQEVGGSNTRTIRNTVRRSRLVSPSSGERGRRGEPERGRPGPGGAEERGPIVNMDRSMVNLYVDCEDLATELWVTEQ